MSHYSHPVWSPVEQSSVNAQWTWDGRPYDMPPPPAPRLGCIPLPDVEPIMLDQHNAMGRMTPPPTPPRTPTALPATTMHYFEFTPMNTESNNGMDFMAYSNAAVVSDPNAVWQARNGLASPSARRVGREGSRSAPATPMWTQHNGLGVVSPAPVRRASAPWGTPDASARGNGRRHVHFDEDGSYHQHQYQHQHDYQHQQQYQWQQQQQGGGGKRRRGGQGVMGDVAEYPEYEDEAEVDGEEERTARRPGRNR